MTSRWFEPGRHHDLWKQWRRIGKGQDDRFFLEHRHAVMESLRGHHRPEQVLLTRELYLTEPDFWEGLAVGISDVQWYLVDGAKLGQVVSVPSTTGLCGVFSPRISRLEELYEHEFLLVLWDIADPGNLGTLIRSARALCRAGVIIVGGCSAWSSKVARASAGSLINTEVAQLEMSAGREALQALKQAGFSLFHAVPRSEQSLLKVDWTGKDVIVLGNESRGLPHEVERSGNAFSIPSEPDVESLNVAMSGAIIAWEWARSRNLRCNDL